MATPYYFPVVGGTEVIIENVSAKLRERGFDIDIITFARNGKHAYLTSAGKKVRMNGLNVMKVSAFYIPDWMRPIKHLLNARYVPAQCLDKFREYDIIHYHNDADLSFPLFSHFVKKPKILHCHCLSVNYNLYKRNFVARHVLKNAANIYIAVSSHVANLMKDLGIPRRKTRTVLNAVDIDRFIPNIESKLKNLLLFVGRLDPVKGLHFLLESLRYLDEPVHLVIAGPLGWNDAYNKEITNSIRRIASKSIHRVTYLGEQRTDELIRWYQRAAIVVVPSTAESLGLVILESMACGTPVIASRVGGIPEIIQHYETGVLVPPRNVAELARSIQHLLSNKKLREKLGDAGRQLVLKRFSYEVMLKKLIQIYEQIV